MTALYFAGTEQPGWRRLLQREGVEHVSLSYIGLRRRRKDPMTLSIAGEYPGQKVFLDSGAYTLNKEGSAVTPEEARELAEAYHGFVMANLDAIEFASEFDATVLGDDYHLRARVGFWSQVPPEKWMPVWHFEAGAAELERMAAAHARVGVLQGDAEGDMTSLLRRLSGQTMLHGVAMTRMDAMAEIPWSSVGSLSWLHTIMHGETYVWTGRELKRYPKKYKDQARKRHRAWLADNGFDAGLIEADDTTELLRLSVWSWRNFAASLQNGRAVTINHLAGPGENEEPLAAEVDTPPATARNAELAPREGKKLLPVLGLSVRTRTDDDGNEVSEAHLTTPESGLLQCSNCFVREKCPEARPGEGCAYEIPAKVRTSSQLAALQDWLIETQAQRVAYMRLVEQLEGGYADANLTTEIQHLARMIKARQDAAKEGFSIKIEATATEGREGMISSIFGRDIADRVGALPAPLDASAVIEAEVVPDGSN